MSKLNLTNLETVCAINRLGSFAAAARRLNASQPAITARVRELEQSMGFSFFQRQGRRMELTMEGRLFVERAAPLIDQLDDLVRLQAHASAMQGVVRIGVGVTTLIWFPKVLALLRNDMPNVHYDIDVDMGMNMLHKLEEGRLDLAIAAGSVTRSRMNTVPLSSVEQRWLMSSRVARCRDGKLLSTGELLDSAPLWFVSRPSDFYPRAIQDARRLGATLRNVNTCANTAALMELMIQTGGIGVVPTILATDHLRAGTLVHVSPELPAEPYPLTLVAHADQRQAIVRHIMDRIVHHDLGVGRARRALERSLRQEGEGAQKQIGAAEEEGSTRSSTTGLRRSPMPSISTSTTSPARIHKGGTRRKPTPAGVPVASTSPGRKGVKREA